MICTDPLCPIKESSSVTCYRCGMNSPTVMNIIIELLRKERDALRTENEALRHLLRRVIAADDLSGWAGEQASPLYDEIDAVLK